MSVANYRVTHNTSLRVTVQCSALACMTSCGHVYAYMQETEVEGKNNDESMISAQDMFNKEVERHGMIHALYICVYAGVRQVGGTEESQAAEKP